ncbi:hypothetical protein ACI2K4_32060 [Micromonospora sp. NPDC050397]|uniref:hypothetical protein n=1 Tax=Micromonospora sp. NPDC050397 TaxID=3364279 RepID=UPI003850735A
MAGWVVLLLLVAYVSVRRDAPTVREQRDVAAAMPVLRQALGRLLTGAENSAVVEIDGPRLEPGCRITPLRDGANLVGSVTLRTAEAEAPALLDRIAEQLPTEYEARVRHRPESGTHTLRADGGEFVAIAGGVTDPGTIRLTAETGCRPNPSGTTVVGTLLGLPIDVEPGRVLAALGLPPDGKMDRDGPLTCGPGRSAQTVRLTVPGLPTMPLGATLRTFAGPEATVVADQPTLYAYRTPALSVVVTLTDTTTHVATTNCA